MFVHGAPAAHVEHAVSMIREEPLDRIRIEHFEVAPDRRRALTLEQALRERIVETELAVVRVAEIVHRHDRHVELRSQTTRDRGLADRDRSDQNNLATHASALLSPAATSPQLMPPALTHRHSRSA